MERANGPVVRSRRTRVSHLAARSPPVRHVAHPALARLSVSICPPVAFQKDPSFTRYLLNPNLATGTINFPVQNLFGSSSSSTSRLALCSWRMILATSFSFDCDCVTQFVRTFVNGEPHRRYRTLSPTRCGRLSTPTRCGAPRALL